MSNKTTFPRIALSQLAEEVTTSTTKSGMKKVTLEGELPKMPIIPPRLTPVVTSLAKNSDDQSWYVVLSPRETRGLSGPFSITQLKQMYRSRDIYDSTLVWKEGEERWQQLVYQSLLRSQLINLPILPPRVGSYNAELAIFDPIAPLPETQILEGAVLLPQNTTDRHCAICGAIAVAHIPGHKEVQQPDLSKGKSEVGATEFAAEILPGFLWIGSAGASKHKTLLSLGITLLINSTDNMKNPSDHPPYFRCRDVPLKEKPTQSLQEREERTLLHMLEMAFDWIEFERTNNDRNKAADPLPKPHHGATDAYGLPNKGADNKPLRRPDYGQTSPEFPPRIMIWSRLGTDRCMVVALAFMIKHFGMSMQRAMKIIKKVRPTMSVSGPYQLVLEKWNKRYALGMLLCVDCKTLPLKPSSKIVDGAASEPFLQIKELLGEHIPRVIKDSREVTSLKDADQYVIPLSTNSYRHGPFSGLMDINLMDRRLSDMTVAFLIQLLTGTKIIHQVRSLNLRNNKVQFLAMKELLMAFFSRDADPDDSSAYYMDDVKTAAAASFASSASTVELTALDLSHNRIEAQGSKYLVFFLKQCQSLVHLDLFHNDIPDDCCADILACLTTPLFDFQSAAQSGNHDSFLAGSGTNSQEVDDDYEDYTDSQSLDGVHNRSVTYLDIGANRLAKFSADALAQMLKQNTILSTLRLTHLRYTTLSTFKDLSNAIRLYNSTLDVLDISGTALSVSGAKHMARIHDSLDTHVTKMMLAQCSLTHLHVQSMSTYLAASRTLTFLDLSNNPLGSKGAEALATIIRGAKDRRASAFDDQQQDQDQDHQDQQQQQQQQQQEQEQQLCRLPPLRHLDLTSCELDPAGCAEIMQAIAGRYDLCFDYIDLSYNTIGAQNNAFVDAMKNARIVALHMHYCSIRTSLAIEMMRAVTYASHSMTISKLTPTLRTLGLSGNDISDSAAEALTMMLKNNFILEVLDLGFNNLTKHCMEYFQDAIKVNSESEIERKVFELTVNLVGNKCSAYALDAPGLARSKVSFRFGLQPNFENDQLGGYAHLEHRVRGKFLAQKAVDDQYRSVNHEQSINHIK